MNALYVFEKYTSAHGYEAELAHLWWSLPAGMTLPLSHGESCRLVYGGRSGGSVGPDVCDAVLEFAQQSTVGDVELHVNASDWYAHQHHTDRRYNNVILHVVLICDELKPAIRVDGTVLPACSLYDLPTLLASTTDWPCQHLHQYRTEEAWDRLLQRAGLLRFERKAHTFVEQLHSASATNALSINDTCLIPALAEALGYGRDRRFFRSVGLSLVGLPVSLPEPLGRQSAPDPLDASRLALIGNLVERWYSTGAWQEFRQIIFSSEQDSSYTDSLHRLRSVFGKLSTGRADILICNVVLPFAVAVALVEQDKYLVRRAEELYLAHPGLPSNQITRAMCRQLRLSRIPAGSCRQQGLHYIYAQTCQAKRCELCIAARERII